MNLVENWWVGGPSVMDAYANPTRLFQFLSPLEPLDGVRVPSFIHNPLRHITKTSHYTSFLYLYLNILITSYTPHYTNSSITQLHHRPIDHTHPYWCGCKPHYCYHVSDISYYYSSRFCVAIPTFILGFRPNPYQHYIIAVRCYIQRQTIEDFSYN